MEVVFERVVGEQLAHEIFAHAHDVFDGFHCLKASDNTAHRADNARLFTSGNGIFWRRVFEYTAVAWSLTRNVGHQLTFEADNSRVAERLFFHNARVVNQEFGGEVVRAVDDEIVIADKLADIR